MEQQTDRLLKAAVAVVAAGAIFTSVHAMMPDLATRPGEVIKKVLDGTSTEQPTLAVSLHSMDSYGYQLFLTSSETRLETSTGADQFAILQPNTLDTSQSYFGAQIMTDKSSNDFHHPTDTRYWALAWPFSAEGEDIQNGRNGYSETAYFNYDENGKNIYINKRYEYFKSQNMDEYGYKQGEMNYSGNTIDEKTNPFPLTFLTPFKAQDSKGNLINNSIRFKSIAIASATKQDGSTITKNDGVVEYNKEFTNYKDLFNEIVKYSDKDDYIDNHNSYEESIRTPYIKQVKLNVTYTAKDKDGHTVTTTAPLVINLSNFDHINSQDPNDEPQLR